MTTTTAPATIPLPEALLNTGYSVTVRPGPLAGAEAHRAIFGQNPTKTGLVYRAACQPDGPEVGAVTAATAAAHGAVGCGTCFGAGISFPAGAHALTSVWISTARAGIDAHRLAMSTDGQRNSEPTGCGRSTRTGVRLLAVEAAQRHSVSWCARCWPPTA